MSAELEYERVRNTYYYDITSKRGNAGFNDLGEFSYSLPPFAYPEHNDSQRAIFTLTGCAVADQVLNQQLGASAYFTLDMSGLGGSKIYNATLPAPADGSFVGLRQSSSFMIPNVYDEFSSLSTNTADAVIITTVPVQRLSGSLDLSNPYVLNIGNPVGSDIIFKLRNELGVLIGNNANLNTVIKFKIELIPNQ